MIIIHIHIELLIQKYLYTQLISHGCSRLGLQDAQRRVLAINQNINKAHVYGTLDCSMYNIYIYICMYIYIYIYYRGFED